jgi:hypothetical protein
VKPPLRIAQRKLLAQTALVKDPVAVHAPCPTAN